MYCVHVIHVYVPVLQTQHVVVMPVSVDDNHHVAGKDMCVGFLVQAVSVRSRQILIEIDCVPTPHSV
jgi:hypothetical protein